MDSVAETLLAGLSGPWVFRLGWILVHFLWQGAVAALALALALLHFRRQSATSRYAAACGAMVLMLVFAAATAFLTWGHAPVIGTPPAGSSVGAGAASAGATDGLPVGAADPAEAPAQIRPALRAPLEALLPYVVIGWLTGVLTLSLRLLGGWAHLGRLRRCFVSPARESIRGATKHLAACLGIARPIEVIESALADVPMVIGWIKPVILVPGAAIAGLSPDQLESILAHELVHVRRHDFLVNLFQTIMETLFFFHPAVWWVSHRIRVEREYCCDDLVVAACGDAPIYALARPTRGWRPRRTAGARNNPLGPARSPCGSTTQGRVETTTACSNRA